MVSAGGSEAVEVVVGRTVELVVEDAGSLPVDPQETASKAAATTGTSLGIRRFISRADATYASTIHHDALNKKRLAAYTTGNTRSNSKMKFGAGSGVSVRTVVLTPLLVWVTCPNAPMYLPVPPVTARTPT